MTDAATAEPQATLVEVTNLLTVPKSLERAGHLLEAALLNAQDASAAERPFEAFKIADEEQTYILQGLRTAEVDETPAAEALPAPELSLTEFLAGIKDRARTGQLPPGFTAFRVGTESILDRLSKEAAPEAPPELRRLLTVMALLAMADEG